MRTLRQGILLLRNPLGRESVSKLTLFLSLFIPVKARPNKKGR
jgi:hypothetical protein